MQSSQSKRHSVEGPTAVSRHCCAKGVAFGRITSGPRQPDRTQPPGNRWVTSFRASSRAADKTPTPSAICHLPSAIYHLPSAIRHPPSAIRHLPSAIRHPPSWNLAHPQAETASTLLATPWCQHGPL